MNHQMILGGRDVPLWKLFYHSRAGTIVYSSKVSGVGMVLTLWFSMYGLLETSNDNLTKLPANSNSMHYCGNHSLFSNASRPDPAWCVIVWFVQITTSGSSINTRFFRTGTKKIYLWYRLVQMHPCVPTIFLLMLKKMIENDPYCIGVIQNHDF